MTIRSEARGERSVERTTRTLRERAWRFLALSVLAWTPVLFGSELAAQSLATDDPVLERIWVEGMERSQVESLSQVLLDEIGPRLTASPQMERAQEWAVETLEGWGIEARLEEYGTWEAFLETVEGSWVMLSSPEPTESERMQ